MSENNSSLLMGMSRFTAGCLVFFHDNVIFIVKRQIHES